MADTRRCDQCGSTFVPRREHGRFCSARCRVAWNRDHSAGPGPAGTALDWSVAAMRDATARLLRMRAWDRARAFTVVSEAVWWVTIVDATLVRYYPEIYDQVLACLPAAERRTIEGTLGGLRYVRNQMSEDLGRADLVHPEEQEQAASGSGSLVSWRWEAAPAPAPGQLSSRAQEWESERHRSYQEFLAGHPIGEAFESTAAFLRRAAAHADEEFAGSG